MKESSRLKVPLLGKIYLNPDITKSTEEGKPYVLYQKNSIITKEYEKIAEQVHAHSRSQHLHDPLPQS